MLRRTMVFLLACVAAFNGIAQDKATTPASQLTGSVVLGVSELNLLDSPYVSDIPGISTAPYPTGIVTLKFTDGLALSYIDLSQYMDTLRRQTRMGYETGITFDAANQFLYAAQTTKYSSNGDSSWYNLIQPMIDWYENNYQRFGMPASPYTSGVWPTDNYDGSSGGRTRFIFGRTVEPIGYIAWDFTKWYDAQKLYSELKLKIEGAIDAVSAQASNGKIIDQYAYAKFVEADRVLAQKELKAWADFHAITDGVDAKASLLAIIQSAYIKFTNIGGVLDARLDFAGVKFSAGTLLGTTRADQQFAGPALSFALPVGLVPNFNASVSANVTGGVNSIIENYETKNSEALPGEPSWIGLKVKGGYSIPDFMVADLSVVWPDLVTRPLSLSSSVNATVYGNGPVSYQAAFEGNFLMWQDRYVPESLSVIAYGAGIDGRVTMFGATPHVLALYKSAGFWGKGGNNQEDRFPGTDLRSDFDAAKTKDALAIDGGLGFDAFPFVNMKLVSVDGGYRMFLYKLADSTAPLAQGWYAGASISFLDLVELPVSIVGSVTNYQNWGPYSTLFTDWLKAPTAGLFTGLTWTASVNWDPTKEIRISAEGSGKESGWRMDTQRVISVGMKASVKF